MRRVRQRMLVSFCIFLLSTTTSIVLAQSPPRPIESPSAASTAEVQSVPSRTVPAQVVDETTPSSESTTTPSNSTESTPNPEATTESATPAPTTSPEVPKSEQDSEDSSAVTKPEQKPESAPVAEPEQSPEEAKRLSKLIEADRLYLGGQFAAAEKIYREVKEPFPETAAATQKRPAPIVDPAQLPPAGQVYWRETEAGLEQKLQTKIMVPLQLLVDQYPQFIPGQVRMAEVLQQSDRSKEALEILERATTLYPDQADLLKAKVTALAKVEKWMEASIAARQFALIYSKHPAAPEFERLADENLSRYKRHVRRKVRGNAIANVITGALGYALTGNLFGPFSAIQTTTLLLRGESSVGESVAKQAKKQLEMVNDETVVNYVNEVGQRLTQVAGRNDFQYEFNVVLDKDINAFALPGGKIFINAGALADTDSEAELAGLVGHELSHAILSHGFQLVTEGNLIGNLTQFIPYGGTLANLFTLSYSRDMERQADIMGTRLLATTGYAADGERNLMVKLKEQEKFSPPSWLASHPVTKERIRYLEELIERNGYNRYAYEGVERHSRVKEQAQKLLAEKKQRDEEKKNRRRSRN